MKIKPATRHDMNSIAYSVRAAQAVLQYGVGAMVDFKDRTLMTAAPEYWEKATEAIHDERLEKTLKVKKFGMPSGEDNKPGISYVQFPEWYFCPKCRRFKSLSEWQENYERKTKRDDFINRLRCPSCNLSLVVARIITVCKCGHIDDFPWINWVHAQNMGADGPKPICQKPAIIFNTGLSTTESLEGLIVTCETCKARATLWGAFEHNSLEKLQNKHGGVYDFSCTGRHPWKNFKEECSEFPRVMQRGSSSVYFPSTASSLVIPPYSSVLTSKIDNSNKYDEYSTKCDDLLENAREFDVPKEKVLIKLDAITDDFSNQIAVEIGADSKKVKEILERKRETADEVESTLSIKYRAEEYDALSGAVKIGKEMDKDFQREPTDIFLYKKNNLPPYVKSISLINKIREVQALVGFSRINPADPTESPQKQADVVYVKEPETDWYPAYQVRGEGIFIEFDSCAIKRWIDANPDIQERVKRINENYAESFLAENRERIITAKFLLLHTLSHLLIKELSFECGYSIASLKERIYCGEESDGKEMSGIFIYTASGDSEGTMGGLVRQGQFDTFPDIFNKALKSALSCSNDPICSLSQGQGRDSLNLSACYACALIPETSCEEFNIFLDRGCIVGTYNNRDMGFYSNYLNGKEELPLEPEPIPDEPKEETRIKIIPDSSEGTDLSDMVYSQIWDSIAEFTEDAEKELLNKLALMSDDFSDKEKPIQSANFYISGDSEVYYCELLWKESKVIYFTAEDEDIYEKAKDGNYKCFCGSDSELTAETILNAIKEK